MRIILGSESLSRRRILERMGYEFTIMPAHIDEKAIRDHDPAKLTLALAEAKARALLTRIAEDALLITADQVVVFKGKILEKPRDAYEAAGFLRGYGLAKTVTSVVVANTATGREARGTDIAEISFDPIPERVIQEYITTGDTFLQSGGFDYEHRLLAPYVQSIQGEPESIYSSGICTA